jgi:transcriptional regulator MraZ
MSESNNNGPCYNSCFDPTVDEKRRVQIPANWRKGQNETEFMLILWPSGSQQDACLMILPPLAAQKLRERITSMPFGDGQAEALRRFLGRKSHMVTSDKSGRITLPEHMATAVGIEKKAVMVGMFDRFQMWNPEKFEAITEGDDALAQEAFKLI